MPASSSEWSTMYVEEIQNCFTYYFVSVFWKNCKIAKWLLSRSPTLRRELYNDGRETTHIKLEHLWLYAHISFIYIVPVWPSISSLNEKTAKNQLQLVASHLGHVQSFHVGVYCQKWQAFILPTIERHIWDFQNAFSMRIDANKRLATSIECCDQIVYAECECSKQSMIEFDVF